MFLNYKNITNVLTSILLWFTGVLVYAVEVPKIGDLQTLININKALSSEINAESIALWYPVPSVVNDDRQKAKATFVVLEKQKSWVDNFSNEDIQRLPLGVKEIVGNLEYAIGITSARIFPEYTELTVFGRIRLPKVDKEGYPFELFFGADNVKLSHDGGIIGEAKLVLLGNVYIPFNAGKWMLELSGGFDYRSGELQDRTYVTVGCDGIKELAIQGAVEFSREVVLPVEADGSVDENKTTVARSFQNEKGTLTKQVPYRVRGDFNVVASNWNDLLVSISLRPFTRAKKRNNTDYNGNFQFFVNQAVLDLSDLRNDPQISFPDHYRQNGLLLPSQQAWRGVYINTVDVRLPKEFKTKTSVDQGRRVGFGAHHLLVDNYGVSGTFYADNLFPLKEGRTNKRRAWAYSLDHIEVTLAANNLVGAAFEGRIILPVSKGADTGSSDKSIGLRYSGLISEQEYLINVRNDSIIDFDLWRAKGQLFPNSSIELAVRQGEFRPKAILNGRLAISASQKKSLENEGKQIQDKQGKKNIVEFKGIVFQNLVLQTESPVFSVDYMGYKGEVKFANFPATISNIGITTNEYAANLYFDLSVNLMGGSNGFAAKTSLAILGKFKEEQYLQKWRFKGLDLNSIDVRLNMKAFEIWGSLDIMEDDPVYGDGFSASLSAKIAALGGTKIGVNAVFGRTDFRYWMFDAAINLSKAIRTGPINLSGFAGGASYRMRKRGFSSNFELGAFSYTPDKNIGMGFKALVLLNVVDDGILKGSAGLEMVFNRGGGINRLELFGQGALLNVKMPGTSNIASALNNFNQNAAAKAKFLGLDGQAKNKKGINVKNLVDRAENEFIMVPPEDVIINATMGITYDFQNSVFHGELNTYLNTPGGFIKGRGARGRAGWAVLHLSPEEWYFYLGTPQDRLGLSIGIGPFRLEAGGYFMVGSILPDSPPPPPIVAEILGVDAQTLDYMRDENALESGRGFAFGADLALDTGDLRFLIFYARFQAGAGFDIMLRDYGEATCSNTGDQVGINGWYANGQAYAYLQGELGIRIKLFFIKKKIPIIKGGAAVLLQAKAPNPVWMRGYVGGYFNLLGGLIKGRFRFKLTLGKECEFANASPLGGLKIITDVTPDDNGSDIDVFAIPQATFAMKVGAPIVIPEDEGDKTYKIILDEYSILHDGKKILGTVKWSMNNDRADFVSTDILPPNQKMTVRVKVSFMERIGGVFRPIMVNGKRATEIEERTFTTGGAPSVIPLQNIEYAYPVLDQKYLYEDEYNKGYIQLKRGQDYLFEDNKWETFLAYGDMQDNLLDTNFAYDQSKNRVGYNIPDLKQSASYRLSIVSKPKNTSSTKQKADSYTNADTGDKSGNNRVRVKSNRAESKSKEGGIERLTYNFTTSEYKTFKRKVNSLNTNDYNWGMLYSDVIYLTNRIIDHESFDLAELKGNDYTQSIPLVAATATLEDNYFKQDINPPLYGRYPLGGRYKILDREVQEYGVPPVKALPILSNYLSNLQQKVNQNMLRTYFPYRYNLGFVYKQDWVDLQSQIVNDYVDGVISNTHPAINFLDKKYLFMRFGFYKVKLQYVLPGGIRRSSAIYKFKNPNKFRN